MRGSRRRPVFTRECGLIAAARPMWCKSGERWRKSAQRWKDENCMRKGGRQVWGSRGQQQHSQHQRRVESSRECLCLGGAHARDRCNSQASPQTEDFESCDRRALKCPAPTCEMQSLRTLARYLHPRGRLRQFIAAIVVGVRGMALRPFPLHFDAALPARPAHARDPGSQPASCRPCASRSFSTCESTP